MKPVPFDETNRGDPFLGDFPEWLDQEQRSELQARVQPQITELAQRRHAPDDRQRLLGLLQQRREPRLGGQEPQQPGQRAEGHGAATAFDFLPVDVGFDTLLARSELLITGQSYDGRHAPLGGRSQDAYAKGYLDSLGIVATRWSATSFAAGSCGLPALMRIWSRRNSLTWQGVSGTKGLWRLSTT